MSNCQPIRGTRDLYGPTFSVYDHVLTTAKTLASLYGYQGIETPIMEYTNVFQRTLGETTDMVGLVLFTFSDRGGESITLRPEGTACAVRALISLGLTQTMPQKLLYSGPMFRYERPQKGRYRQFYQVGVECLGLSSPVADVECMAFAHHFLSQLGVHHTLHVNTLGCADSRMAYRAALVSYFEQYVADLSPDSQVRLHKNPLRILDSKNPKDQEICTNAPLMADYLLTEAALFFDTVCKGLDTLKIPYIRDPKLVRGIDYYCHTAFEFKTNALGAQDALGGGGRYDSLMKQMGGPETPGVGWAFGVDRLMLVLESTFTPKALEKVALIPVGDHLASPALELMQQLRHQGVPCEMTYTGNIGKRLKYAHKLGCTQALIFGDTEWNQGKMLLRQLSNQGDEKEQLVNVEELGKLLLIK
jgi:histidyl-tRNA synthetase